MQEKPTTSTDNLHSNGKVQHEDWRQIEVRDIIAQYMMIQQVAQLAPDVLPTEDQSIIYRNESHLLVTFAGELLHDSELVYSELDKELSAQDMYVLLRQNPEGANQGQPHVIHVLAHRPIRPKAWSALPNLVLFIVTIISVMLTGAAISLAEMQYRDEQALLQQGILLEAAQAEVNFGAGVMEIVKNIWRGWPYALSILLILVPHEMGHYLMMRRHNAEASLPFFIPAFLISPFGTFGAAIVLRETLKNRKTLLDVGAAGPIAGFVIAVPILLIGMMTSIKIPIEPDGIVEGVSLLYGAAKWMVLGQSWLDGTQDILLNQLAWAGWTGLFVTALNMLPLGQLDGGHVLYSLLGDKARKLYFPLLLAMVGLALFLSLTWLLFALMLYFVGRNYAVPMDNITPLDAPRRVIAIVALVILVLTFTPVPIYQRGQIGGLLYWLWNWISGFGVIGVAFLLTVPRRM
ncbi:MAG: site-2 protease family protein [Anaerolineae bacterium]|nr:site-2 protease family protein [Anaerolineae bacterium]